LTTLAKEPAGVNAGFVIGDDGVSSSTHSRADAARQLLAEIRQRTKLPVRFVINTHYHLTMSRVMASSRRQAPLFWRSATCAAGFTPKTGDYSATA
jgi:hypothetical protein